MKIAYIISPGTVVSNRSNGIRSQAETWAKQLISLGHQVDLVSPWGNYDWKSYDVIHLFGNGSWISLAASLSEINPNIHWSPIYDPLIKSNSLLNKFKQNIKHFIYIVSLNHLYRPSEIEISLPFVRKISVRSNCEKRALQDLYGLEDNRFELVPLSYSDSCAPYELVKKENFCLHISSIYQSRKNVIRLIKAAKKYNFELVIAGNKGTEKQFQPIKDEIGEATNIRVLGFISEEEKVDLYKRAKVFALPSIQEGVGIVALDAAYYSCEIVLTNIPGPKEYYNGNCFEVNPLNVDEIGKAIINAMNNTINYQPQLSRNIQNAYAPDMIAKRLVLSYLNK